MGVSYAYVVLFAYAETMYKLLRVEIIGILSFYYILGYSLDSS